MAFELKDFFRSYVKRGDFRGLFNIARSDESTVEGATRYYAFLNENGSYVIQQIATSGSLVIKVYGYYARGNANTTRLNTDWAGRTSLAYVDYYELFKQGT